MANHTEHVMNLMSSEVMNHVVDDTVVAVNRGQMTEDVCPLGVGEPRDVNLRVLQERDYH